MGNWVYICVMVEKLIPYIIVILSSAFRFGLGPVMGKIFALSIIEIVILMIIGMMLTIVFLTTIVGDLFYGFLKKTIFKNSKIFSPKTRRIVRVWNKRGLIGIAFLTPILFSPVGGGLIAVSFGEEKKKIIIYMFLSACFWAPITVLFMDQIITVVLSFIKG